MATLSTPLSTVMLTFDPGQKIVALIETTAAVCVEKFTDYPQLGRFDEGRTIAIGKVRVYIDFANCSLLPGLTPFSQKTKLIKGSNTIEEVAEGVSNLSTT